MSLTQVILLFSLESIFFVALLCVCLKFASNRHRDHLKGLLEQVKKASLTRTNQEEEKINNEELRRRLMEQIEKLKDKLRKLQGVELEYQRLKKKYEDEQAAATKKVNSPNEPVSTSLEVPMGTAAEGSDKKYRIQAGTTVDSEFGVGPAYLNYLARKKCLTDASTVSAQAYDENKTYGKKIREQKEVISELLEKLQQQKQESETRDIKDSSRERTIQSLKDIEQSLLDSQNTSTRLDVELSKVKRQLQASQEKVVRMEGESAVTAENKENNGKELTEHSYIVISRAKSDGNEVSAADIFSNFDHKNYEALKKEVEKLRANSKTQRQMIFVMESQLLQLQNDLNSKDLSEEEKEEKELQIKRLQRLLMESEGCIDVLESEVSFLQDRIETMSNIEQCDANKILKMDHTEQREVELTTKLEKARQMLTRASIVQEKLGFVIELMAKKPDKEVMESLATRVLESMEQFAVDVHVRIDTRFGQVDIANCGGIRKDQLELLKLGLEHGGDAALLGADGFVLARKYVGVFVRAKPETESILGRLEDALMFVTMVCDAVATAMEERQVSQVRQNAIQRVVDSVKKNLSNVSIQSKYQSQEAKRIIDTFLKELNQSLQTLNITENQSKLFDEMIDEVSERMRVLFASEVAVDGSFAQLMDKLEKGQVYWGN